VIKPFVTRRRAGSAVSSTKKHTGIVLPAIAGGQRRCVFGMFQERLKGISFKFSRMIEFDFDGQRSRSL